MASNPDPGETDTVREPDLLEEKKPAPGQNEQPDPGHNEQPDPGNVKDPDPGITEIQQNPDIGQLDHKKDQQSLHEADEKIIDAIPKSLGARARTKTAAGKGFYQSQLHDFQKKLQKHWTKMEDLLINLDKAEVGDLQRLRKIEDELKRVRTKHNAVFKDFMLFLTRNSDKEMIRKSEIEFERKETVVTSVLTRLQALKLEAAEVLSQRISDSESSSASSQRSFVNKKDLTEQYVSQHFSDPKPIEDLYLKTKLNKEQYCEYKIPQEKEPFYAESLCLEKPREKLKVQATPKPNRFYDQDPPVPNNPNSQLHSTVQDDSVLGGLVQFLLKKDLLLTRFSKFNDSPETFIVWKTSFKSIVNELNVSPFEEMDLLVKWLGPTSSTFASSIRASNVHAPERGLQRIWERLHDRYGRPEMVEATIKKKLDSFPKLSSKEMNRLYDLLDILSELESTKSDVHYSQLLSYFDTSSGINPIVNKLPYGLQEKWTTRASMYKKQYKVPFPPLSVFIDFIRDMSEVKNDPAFVYDNPRIAPSSTPACGNRRDSILNRKTYVQQETMKRCPIHKAEHSLLCCRQFLSKPLEERRKFLKEKRICFKCCESTNHMSRDCNVKVKCEKCGSNNHRALMHVDRLTNSFENQHSTVRENGGEDNASENVASKCTVLCDKPSLGRSCGKIVLVNVFLRQDPNKAIKVYAILDDQSNRTLISPRLCDRLDVQGPSTQYSLSSCSGTTTMTGRRIEGLCAQSVHEDCQYELPITIECDDIPNERSEIPTPDVARFHYHLNSIVNELPSIEKDVNIELLIGRDVPEAHHVFHQITGPKKTPFAQKLGLGWVIIGDVCLGKVHRPDLVRVMKTSVLNNGRTTQFNPCENHFQVKEHQALDTYDTLFQKSPDDDKIGLSVEDRKFLSLMDEEFQKDENGKWIAPLPFRSPKPMMPNNRSQAWRRARILDASLKKNEVKKTHFIEFMKKVFDSGAAEIAPVLDHESNNEMWYLPIFGVYNSKKPNQVRGVFDSSAVYEGHSLNKVLMTGPDLTNSLIGILLRFRQDRYAVIADIEQMFYQFYVKKEHRDFLRFFWYKNNNPDLPLIEYRMCVHVFGNAPSPAIATYGLRKTVENCENTYGSDVKDFVNRNFYVDDGLVSSPSREKVIDLIKRTKTVFKENGNLRLHKIASNDREILNSFGEEDLNKNLRDVHFGENSVLPLQHSLGLSWDLNHDSFLFEIQDSEKPNTRRGLLSFLNSIFDPLGFLSPITLSGKILLRQSVGADWDQPLSTAIDHKWKEWKSSLQCLQDLRIPRMYLPVSLSCVNNIELHVFCDASETAIAATAYLKITGDDNASHLGFILGKAKLAPMKGHTIPRLELCGAVLASEIGQTVLEQLDVKPNVVKYYTDSKVVLGYIYNQSKRFYTYVTNRVSKILKVSSTDQWNYVPTHKNPADCATRGNFSSEQLQNSEWLQGPQWLLEQHEENEVNKNYDFPLIDPQDDKEIRPDVQVMKTTTKMSKNCITELAEKFSKWKTFIKFVACLKHVIKSFKHRTHSCSGWHMCENSISVQSCQDAEKFVLKEIQKECFSKEILSLQNEKTVSKDSRISTLSPFIDSEGLLRVGGRLNNVKNVLPTGEINPIILPNKHHVSTLLIRFYHDSVRHQGRHFTEGALRKNGLWIIGAKREVSSFIHNCVTCRKLRGKFELQKMADLPSDRITPGLPFTTVGVDTFGPWTVLARKTRGGVINNKRWAIMFSCLTTRAIHIEVIEEMSSSSFINALRRFEAIRGPVKVFRSDKGTNFVGAADELGIQTLNVEDGPIKKHLRENGTVWIFNSPHSSHMGGSWERMIGLTRRILDAILLDLNSKQLTHETLTTFMAEVCSIINSRPLVQISSDPDSTLVLSPMMLLTGKVNYLPVIPESDNIKDMYRAQWKHVQVLSEIFWKHWRQDYLQNLQPRRKWRDDRPNLKVGDVILLKDSAVHRTDWPIGVITETYQSSDGKVRKARVRVHKDGQNVMYTRPISEMVMLNC
nr:uncharacterized protein LOC105335138 [Crassostrea gigas]